jgi:flagellar biosynthetic protein FliP
MASRTRLIRKIGATHVICHGLLGWLLVSAVAAAEGPGSEADVLPSPSTELAAWSRLNDTPPTPGPVAGPATDALLPARDRLLPIADSAGVSPVDVESTESYPDLLVDLPEQLTRPERLSSTLQLVLTMSIVSLAPAILLMTTSFVRIAVVLGLLRQALGIQQLPSNQVVTSIAMFMTLLIMTPVWTEVYEQAVRPYTDPAVEMSAEEAWEAGVQPVRRFMSRQIFACENGDDIWLFYQYLPESTPAPEYYDDVPLQVLLPAFMLSELKTAFMIGFQIYLPFVILDLVVSSITASMGMVMLPPMLISLPLKLMLFVLVDGWNLVVGMLLQSFTAFT